LIGHSCFVIRHLDPVLPVTVNEINEVQSQMPPAGTFAIVTFGCKVNQYESQAIRELLLREGCVEVAPADKPPIYVVNTCAVTQATENECRRTIRRFLARAGGPLVIVTGCMADLGMRVGPGARVVRKEEAARIASICGTGIPACPTHSQASVFDLTVSGHAGHARALLKIQDGCDARCSYCIVPKARGPSRSRPAADILAEAERLRRNGYPEIVLTGVHIGGYGRDAGNMNLSGLLRALPGRIRLGSLELGDVSNELLEIVASDRRFCPHFHVPLQSGDADVLRRMDRRYSPSDYLRRMEEIKRTVALPSLTTDVIVGFPGETEDAFRNTLDLCRKVGFSRIHVFSFSPRPGTPAAEMPGRVPPRTIRQRKERLQAVAAELADDYNRRMIGREADLLIEYGRDRHTARLASKPCHPGGLLHGHTERYVGVLIDGPDEWMGTIRRVRIGDSMGGHLRAVPTE
jgi:threonylcarbamoyladenosine tRNA methylthiotransferase MtaB